VLRNALHHRGRGDARQREGGREDEDGPREQECGEEKREGLRPQGHAVFDEEPDI
jgi:hypothetical protein